MPNQQAIERRNRIIGNLICGARERARITPDSCAEVLGISPARFAAYEKGAELISLPELELLGRYLGSPLYILRRESLADEDAEENLPAPQFFLSLRHRSVGVRLQQARMQAGHTQEDLAELLEHPISTIAAYEYGELPIPLAELELVARALVMPLDFFLDSDSEVGMWHQAQQEFERFTELPAELREFALRPINRSYLELAMKLAEMPAGALRQIAEGLLEITY